MKIGVIKRKTISKTLEAILSKPGLGVREIIKATGSNPMTVIKALRFLEKKGIVWFIPGKNRKKRYYPSPGALVPQGLNQLASEYDKIMKNVRKKYNREHRKAMAEITNDYRKDDLKSIPDIVKLKARVNELNRFFKPRGVDLYELGVLEALRVVQHPEDAKVLLEYGGPEALKQLFSSPEYKIRKVVRDTKAKLIKFEPIMEKCPECGGVLIFRGVHVCKSCGYEPPIPRFSNPIKL
ncbi:MAG: winged helix-turn-helix transcriptional regulator [Thermoproteota archaeon]|nr:winged helix-turn-helix transcriptional regulator [Candidatus Brockarchaeota archaeon]